MSKTLTLAEVAAHDREEDCYLIIGNERTGGAKVYDVTKYLDEHPGGDAVLLELAGKSDDMFEDIGHSMSARQQRKGPCGHIGRDGGGAPGAGAGACRQQRLALLVAVARA